MDIMKTYKVGVGFLSENKEKVLYKRHYPILEESKLKAAACVLNTLYVLEYYNIKILDVEEMETEGLE